MPKFIMYGIDELCLSMEELADLPDEVLDEMLMAEAEVAVEAQKRVGRRMGVEDTGMTLNSIRVAKKTKKSAAGGRYVEVYPAGRNKKGNRNTEVAFINEFGASERNIASRPFMRKANEECADEAVDAAARVYDAFLRSKNL